MIGETAFFNSGFKLFHGFYQDNPIAATRTVNGSICIF